MHNNHVALAWLEYSSLCLPAACSPVQRSETMKAFYAGFMMGLDALVNAKEEEVVEKYTAIRSELELFVKEIEKGAV